MRIAVFIGAIACLAASALAADFSYLETVTVTGGSAAALTRSPAGYSKATHEPLRAAVSVSGNRMLRRMGEAVECARPILFLLSDDASFITASNFLVDGGISAAYVTPL